MMIQVNEERGRSILIVDPDMVLVEPDMYVDPKTGKKITQLIITRRLPHSADIVIKYDDKTEAYDAFDFMVDGLKTDGFYLIECEEWTLEVGGD